MISAENICKLMREASKPFWKIQEVGGSTLASNTENGDINASCTSLTQKLDMFSQTQGITVVCATKNELRANWKGASRYDLLAVQTFSSPNNMQPVTAGEMQARLEVVTIKNDISILRMDMEREKTEAFDWKPFLPLIMQQLGIQMPAETASLSGTDDEVEIADAQLLFEELIEENSVGLRKMILLMGALKANPQNADMLINLINTSK